MTHPVKFNQVVQKTLTCLELEIASSQPTIPSGSTHPGSDSDEDVRNNATMLNPSEFIGAAVSMLPPGEGSGAIFEGTVAPSAIGQCKCSMTISSLDRDLISVVISLFATLRKHNVFELAALLLTRVVALAHRKKTKIASTLTSVIVPNRSGRGIDVESPVQRRA